MRAKIILLGVITMIMVLAPCGAYAYNIGALSFSTGQQRLVISTDVAYIARDVEGGGEDELTSRRMLVKTQFGVLDYLDVYAKFGLADLVFDKTNFESSLDFIYGGGLKVTPYISPNKDVFASIDAQFLYFNPSDHDVDADVIEYTVAATVAGKWENFFPYGGLKYSDTVIDIQGASKDIKGDKKVGVVVGSEYFINPNIFFNLELQIFDLNGIFVGLGYKF